MMEPSLPDQDGDAADHDGDVAEDVHHLLGEFPPLYSEGYAEEPLFHHSMAGLVFRDAPEDHGAGPVPQWVEGGLHGQGEGSRQVPPGGARHVLEIEETFILNVPIWWPGVSQDSILWKTTRVVPPSFSLATARCSWLEQFPASHVTGQICTTFCLVCSYEFSIHTQLLLLRAYSKSCSHYTTKPTLRRVFISKKFGLGYEEDAVIQERSQEEVCTPQIPPSSPKVKGDKVVCEAATEKD